MNLNVCNRFWRLRFVAMGTVCLLMINAMAQEWSGNFMLRPVSAPDLVLEATNIDGKIWKRQVKTHGEGVFMPWTKVNGTPL